MRMNTGVKAQKKTAISRAVSPTWRLKRAAGEPLPVVG